MVRRRLDGMECVKERKVAGDELSDVTGIIVYPVVGKEDWRPLCAPCKATGGFWVQRTMIYLRF